MMMFDAFEANIGSPIELARTMGPGLEERILAFVAEGFERWRSKRFHRYGDYENHFTAALVGCMREVRRELGLPYQAHREFVNDTPEILAGDADPDKASRIDITVSWDRLADD